MTSRTAAWIFALLTTLASALAQAQAVRGAITQVAGVADLTVQAQVVVPKIEVRFLIDANGIFGQVTINDAMIGRATTMIRSLVRTRFMGTLTRCAVPRSA